MPDGRKLVTQERLMELRDMAQDGVGEGATFELSCAEMVALLDHIDTLGEGLDLESGDYCRVCGCTHNNSCEHGCGWAAEGLCTACRHDVQPCDDGVEGWVVVDRLSGEVLGDDHGEVVYMDREQAEQAAREGRVAMDPNDEDPLGEVDDA